MLCPSGQIKFSGDEKGWTAVAESLMDF